MTSISRKGAVTRLILFFFKKENPIDEPGSGFQFGRSGELPPACSYLLLTDWQDTDLAAQSESQVGPSMLPLPIINQSINKNQRIQFSPFYTREMRIWKYRLPLHH